MMNMKMRKRKMKHKRKKVRMFKNSYYHCYFRKKENQSGKPPLASLLPQFSRKS